MKQITVVNGLHARYILLRIWLRIATIALRTTGSPGKMVEGYKLIRQRKKQYVSKGPIRKIVKAGNRYFWDLNQPGFPSRAFDQNFKWMIENGLGEKKHVESVRMVFFSITKKCPMNCEHCYEWDEINKKEVLDLDTMKKILKKYQDLGAAEFVLSGGEPLVRFDDLVALLRSAKDTSDFWITTSGFNLTQEKAQILKEAGLTGVSVSLDHFDPDLNNIFRGRPDATDHAVNAIKNAREAGLNVASAIVATKPFISKENMLKYAEYSKSLGAGFIWLIEPRAVGRYAGKDVELGPKEQVILDEFYFSLNNDPKYKDFPRVIFPNINQRNSGCAGAGSRNIMIDTDGYINACPYCRKKGVHALDEASEDSFREIIGEGCFKFENRFDHVS